MKAKAQFGIIMFLFLTASFPSLAGDRAALEKRMSDLQKRMSNIPPDDKRWDVKTVKNISVYSLLIKKESTGNGFDEWRQWERNRLLSGKKDALLIDNEDRLLKLREIIEKYPDSQYSDDAAVLLARYQYLYKGDPDSAIKGLYKAIADYPNGAWIAEDPVWLESVIVMPPDANAESKARLIKYGWFGILGKSDNRTAPSNSWDRIEYFEYSEANPNLTSDEARLTIARIIYSEKLESRYAEADSLLLEMTGRLKARNRLLDDFKYSESIVNNKRIQTRLIRPELKAGMLLIDQYALRNDTKSEKAIILEIKSYIPVKSELFKLFDRSVPDK